MRSLPFLMMSVVALGSCTSKPVHIAADRCWSVSVGDKVEGTAVLSTYADNMCIECGASVRGRNCPAVGFATANDTVDQVYDRIIHTASSNDLGFVQQVVFLSGDVVPNGATGKPMIRATRLRTARTNGS